METLFIVLALGGASLILLICGVHLICKYPRIPTPSEPRGFTEAEWQQITKDNEAWLRNERERIQRGEICSDKSHWRGE